MRKNRQDDADIELAHCYRLSLRSAPRQSSFRVVAVIFYELLGQDHTNASPSNGIETSSQKQNKRLHVVGSNDEPCYMNGAICAERAALVQIRFLPVKRITKVVITTDAIHPIFPGMLCREFMSSHLLIDPETVPIVTAGSICRRSGCGLDIGSSAGGENEDWRMKECSCPSEASDTDKGKIYHDWEIIKTTLPELYPYPSPYTRFDAAEAASLGKKLSSESSIATQKSDEMSVDGRIKESNIYTKHLTEEAKLLIQRARKAAVDGNDRLELHPIQYGAAVMFEDGSIKTACQRKALEYGCSLDAVTQLATYMEERKGIPKLIVQTDQFGLVHTPFATARAYLSEFGFGNCGVLVMIKRAVANEEGSHIQTKSSRMEIIQVSVKEIAPSAPRMGSLWEEG